jgi:predicted porin
MQKTLVAAALLAGFAATAAAQSSVTVYGRVDVGISYQNDGTSTLAGGNGAVGSAGKRWDVRQGSTSRLGFRGTEDLGDGLKAGFLLEHRFQSDTGAVNNASAFWEGRSLVELSSKTLGTVYAGREYVPLYFSADALDPFGGDTVGKFRDDFEFAGYRVTPSATGTVEGVRSNNTVGFKTLNYSGFAAQVAVAAGEGARKRDTGINAVYAAGPVYATLAYDGRDGDNNVYLVGGAYDFGVVKPMVSYSRAESRTGAAAVVKTTNWLVGATAPIGAGKLKAAYASFKPDGANNDIKKFAIGYEYFLSKRTSLYGDIGSAKREALTRTTGYDMGIKHNF